MVDSGNPLIPPYKKPPKPIDMVMIKQAAALIASGSTVADVAKTLDITHFRAKNLINGDECRRLMNEIGNEALATAKERIRKGTAGMVDDILATIRQHLKDGNLQAIPHALKILGFTESEGEVKDTTINLVLPGQQVVKDVTATYEVKDEVQD